MTDLTSKQSTRITRSTAELFQLVAYIKKGSQPTVDKRYVARFNSG
ncbi:hypothetical protein [Bacillus cereus]|nr:hypothetical protein [Bacillus cereus]